MNRFKELVGNLGYVWREDGAFGVAHRLNIHAGKLANKVGSRFNKRDETSDFADVVFINGCDYSVPHPIRYRVEHQAEQLESVGFSTHIINAWDWNDDWARLGRSFIIFRCPYSDFIGHIIEFLHSINKRVYFDIDDLVIDTVYTDQIPYLNTMSPEERAQYDQGVRLMGKTLSLCDGAITTTEQLAAELRKYVDTVFVNRNVASEEMFFLSDKELRSRDILPNLPKNEVKPKDRHRRKVAIQRKKERDGFSIGYFSGSITHNDDFEMILPALVRFMSEFKDVKLHVVGDLDLPPALQSFSSRVVRLPFSPWRHLPKLLAGVDVNLAPLCDTVFNRAKSENKWIEAALVKVPTIASDIGAFADSVSNGVNGLLCSDVDDWYNALVRLHEDGNFRQKISQNAYDECVSHHLTCGTGMPLANFIRSHECPNIAFVIPGFDISGGVLVALKHAEIMRRAGYDVTVIGPNEDSGGGKWLTLGQYRVPALLAENAFMRGHFDKFVATMWSTLALVKHYTNADQRFYLVQNKEEGFYKAGDSDRADVSRSYGYNPNISYLTISPWCKKWLEHDYGKKVGYAANGIDLAIFSPVDRDWSGKIRILVEGDSSSEYKNVAESFEIIKKLDSERFEIWYMSYKGEPETSWRVDKFLQRVPHDEVGAIYKQCHILLKTSVLESFSYPPLEMMATGGAAVVLRNEGNAAYLVDGENGLLFNRGEDEKAAKLIMELVENSELREKLRVNGLSTAQRLSWDALEEDIVKLYE